MAGVGQPQTVEEVEGGVVAIPGSLEAKERCKWEMFHTKWGPPGREYRYEPYPKMLYKAFRFDGKVACMATPPNPTEFAIPSEYQRAEERARRFTEQCQRIVNDEVERSRAFEDGWRESPGDAVEWFNLREDAISRAAAERHYTDARMSEAAQREAKEAEAANDGMHLAEVPEKPKRRGWPLGKPRKPKE